MSFVQDFEKQESNDLYKATICNKEREYDCQQIYDNYKLENAYPFQQTFPFDSTKENDVIMVPDRIIRDKIGIQELIYKNSPKQSCFRIDPKDRFSSTIYCDNPLDDASATLLSDESTTNIWEESSKISYRFLWVLLFTIFFLLAIIFVCSATKYVLDSQQKTNV